MRVRSMLLSTVLCGGVLAISAHHAGAVPTLKPQGNWAVTKIEAKQPGATPYCALARRFGNGSIVTFARNSFNETSVAVDFPPGSFKKSKDYTVVLDPGAGETRSYKTKPVSERGIVIRMGRDDKFYDALEQNGTLAINVDDQAFTFAMPDVKSGTQDLAACLGTTVEPAAGASVKEAAAAPAPAVVPVSTAELESIKEENTRLRNALERERRTYEDKMQQGGDTSATAELAEKLQLLQHENAALKGQIVGSGKAAPVIAPAAPVAACAPSKANDETVNLLRAENTQLKSDLDSQKQRIALAPVAADNAQLGSLKAENEKLKAEIQADKQKLAAIAPTSIPSDSAEIGTLRAENAQLKSDLDSQKQKIAALELAQKTPAQSADATAQISSLREQVAKLQSDNLSLKSIVDSRQASVDDMKSNVATIARLKGVEAEMTQLKAERDKLSGQISAMTKASGDGRVKISSDNWNLEQATERFNQAELEIRRLGSVVEQERAKCSVEKKNIEYMLFDPKIASKEQIAKLITLENQLAEAQQAGGAKDKLEAADKSVQDLKAQLNAANDQVALLKQNLDEAKHVKVAASESSPVVVDSLKQEIASLNNQISNLQSEKAAAEKLERISPASGGEDIQARPLSRVLARPDTVVTKPAIEIDTEAMNPPVAATNVPLPVVASTEPTPIMPPSVAAKPLPATVAEVPVESIASSANNVKLMGQGDIDALLNQAGIKIDRPAQSVTNSTGPGRVTYRWETEGLFGTAEQKTMDSAAQYDRFVQDYLDKTKSRCKGEFAAVPGLVSMNGSNRISSYEIACVDEKSGGDASAALAFYSQSGTFTTIAHESSAESMDLAMDARDKIISVIDGSRTASR